MFITNTAGEEKLSGTSRRGKILVMDDEEMIRDLFDQLLVRLDYPARGKWDIR
jgi:hypothetical protein